MPTFDKAADIAAILSPMPTFGPDDDPMVVDAITEQVQDERADIIRGLEGAWDQHDSDPLLGTLTDLRRQRLRLEEQMRLLVAYGRHFMPMRPYRLTDLAEAAGMSISGVRTSYDGDDLDTVAAILDRPPMPDRAAAADSGPIEVAAARHRRSGD